MGRENPIWGLKMALWGLKISILGFMEPILGLKTALLGSRLHFRAESLYFGLLGPNFRVENSILGLKIPFWGAKNCTSVAEKSHFEAENGSFGA